MTQHQPHATADSVPTARLNTELVDRIKSLEEELRSATGDDIVLIAYDNSDGVTR